MKYILAFLISTISTLSYSCEEYDFDKKYLIPVHEAEVFSDEFGHIYIFYLDRIILIDDWRYLN